MTMLFAFLFMLLTVAAMAIGVMFGRKPIAGSCGGLKALGMAGIDAECEICGGNPARCDSPGGSIGQTSPRLGVDAMAPRKHTREI